jgi:ABC-type Mn2+/Zn2+ transport system ATPase subunit
MVRASRLSSRGYWAWPTTSAARPRPSGNPWTRAANRGRIGYVPQRHTLATSVRATVSEIVAIGRLRFRTWWRPWARDSARDRQEIARALDLVGLGDRAGSDVGHLSGGQQRRVLIARALASAPELLVMDEPTAGVDQANQQVLAAVLARLADTGTTMLVVTHEIAALADVVTRVVAVSDGVVAFDGTPRGVCRCRTPRSARSPRPLGTRTNDDRSGRARLARSPPPCLRSLTTPSCAMRSSRHS